MSTVSVFPYSESFEANPGTWLSGGLNNDWAWGSPTKTVITGAGAGTKCWISGGLSASFYNYGERSWVESPCFDFTTLNRPYVSFLVFWDTEKRYDGGNFQYSLDLGVTWYNVGSTNDPVRCNDQNWYNLQAIVNLGSLVSSTQGWSGTTQPTSGSCNGGSGSGSWKRATHCMKFLANKSSVKFRFTFGSGTTCNDYDGLAFDDFYIGEAPTFPDVVTYSCTGGRTINFKDANPDCHDFWNWDFGDVSSSSNTATGNNVNHNFTSGGNYTVTLSTGGDCSIDTQIVSQVKLLSASVQTTQVSCVGDSDGTAQITLLNGSGGETYSWSHDNLLNADLATNLKPGDYLVTISDPPSCTTTLIASVVYGPDASPQVSLGDDRVVCPGAGIVLFPGSYSSYLWQDNSTDSFYIATAKGIYSVRILNASGCEGSDTIQIKEDCLGDILFPNAFTPNGDGINEVFKVSGSETTKFNLNIYDRWGQLIFSSDDVDMGWDGSLKGHPVQEGFYNYLVSYSIGENEMTRKGSVFLIR